MKEKVQAILNQGSTCFCNRQLIYNHAEEMFADAGIMAIEHVDFDGIERLALVTGRPCRAMSWSLPARAVPCLCGFKGVGCQADVCTGLMHEALSAH